MNPDFWKGKRVLLTGHTGFKGGWLTLWLQNAGADLYGLALEPSTEPNIFTIARVGEGMHTTFGDIRDFGSVYHVVEYCKPEIIIHLAAQPLVRYSYQHPIETYATNVMGTVHILEAARQVGSTRVIINVTSDKCYENNEWVWGYRENDPMGGYDPYSSSKGCAELVTSTYQRSFLAKAGVGIASVRAGNVIGGGDWAEDRLIPDILRAFEESRPVVVRNPSSVRPWQHVLEPLSGYLILAERMWDNPIEYSGAWNFGPSDDAAFTVQWIVEHLASAWDGTAIWKCEHGVQPHEAGYLKLDSSKVRTQLQWKSRWNTELVLRLIADWHKAFLDGYDMRTVTVNQIKQYQNTIPS